MKRSPLTGARRFVGFGSSWFIRPPPSMERLQKILSQAGVASRRAAEQLMLEGRVTVNGATIRELGTKADAASDDIRVDGRRVKAAEAHRYLLLNKPRGYITSRSDPERRPTVIDLLAGVREYVYPVGRLDFESEGLLILTNDGDARCRVDAPEPRRAARVRSARARPSRSARPRSAAARRVHRRPPNGARGRGAARREKRARRAATHHPRRAESSSAEDVRSDRTPGRRTCAAWRSAQSPIRS